MCDDVCEMILSTLLTLALPFPNPHIASTIARWRNEDFYRRVACRNLFVKSFLICNRIKKLSFLCFHAPVEISIKFLSQMELYGLYTSFFSVFTCTPSFFSYVLFISCSSSSFLVSRKQYLLGHCSRRSGMFSMGKLELLSVQSIS